MQKQKEEKKRLEEEKKRKVEEVMKAQLDEMIKCKSELSPSGGGAFIDDLAFSVFDVAGSSLNIIIEGSHIKRNWYNKLQLRHFQMFTNGDVKYHLC